jgi:hypothetical protein
VDRAIDPTVRTSAASGKPVTAAWTNQKAAPTVAQIPIHNAITPARNSGA